MNHDITHCEGVDCPAKETCYRYIAHKDAIKRKLTYLTYLIQDKEEIRREGKCHIYWPIKENEKTL